MQALKPESWSPVLLPELGAQGKGVSAGCPTRKLDRRRLGQSKCLKLQGSLVDVLAHVPRSELCGEGGGAGEELWLPLEWFHTHPSGSSIQNEVELYFDRTGSVTFNPEETDLTPPEGYSHSFDWSDDPGSRPQSTVSSDQLFPSGTLGHLETVRIRCTPGREWVRVCTLSSVRNGWLPLPKRGVLYELTGLLYQRQIELRIDSIRRKSYDSGVILKEGKLDDNWSKSMGFRSGRFPNLPTSNINEASTKDITPSWSMWRGQGERAPTSPSLMRPTHSGDSQRGGHVPHRGSPTLLRMASVPNVLGGRPKTGFSSITITSCRVSQSGANRSHYPHQPILPIRSSTSLNPVMSHVLSSAIPKHSEVVTRHKATIVKVTEYRQSYSACAKVQMRGPGMRTAWPEHRHSYTGEDSLKDNGSSFRPFSLQPSFRSCVQLEVHWRSANTVLYLDKSLSISIGQPEVTKPVVHRSTLSLYVGGSSHIGTSMDYPKTLQDLRRSMGALSCTHRWDNLETDVGYSIGSSSTNGGYEVPKMADTDGIKNRTSDLTAHNLTSGLLSSARGTGDSYSRASQHNGIADELCCRRLRNSTHRHPAFNISPVDTRTWGRQSLRKESDERQGHSREDLHVAEYFCTHQADTCQSQLTVDPQDIKPRAFSLKEALEMFRPDFISRSQGRMRSLEQRARRRKALQCADLDQVQGLWEEKSRHRRNCTKPHPLSDNLFKPRERAISGKEMQLRSRRIYNKLPEVTKKKEEEKRRVVSQTNRLRAELFKKKLLDKILQR
ncbi:(E2-independent) E3 ubiquitin-conjugating enzyme FATS-like [Salvelinus alpinus]|uniref:(E2-independent) E3 ubiquitin-conjugating enzyme FATS-like n=1 Tax=Salvelinus alpinus TaxID=8036 RepID=UPI0039FBB90E